MIARRILLALTVLFIALVAIRIPQHARPGLDAAWSLALSVAHTNHLVFGRDIAFTFGPLGYLINGVSTADVIVDLARFSVVVALIYAITSIATILSPMSLTQRVVLSIALLCLAASPSGDDYLLLFAFLAALGARSLRTPRRTVAVAFVLGTIAGVAAMTKFTLAIDCGGAAILFYVGSFVAAPRTQKSRWIAAALVFVATFLAATIASFGPTPVTLLAASLAFGCGIAACIWTSRRMVFGAIGASIAIASIFLISPTLIDFARISLALAADYSSAMSIPGVPGQLRLAIAEIAVLTAALIALAFEGNLGLSAALAFALFGGFKHGFVRQDGHVFYFVITAAAVGAIAYAALRRPGARRLGFVAAVISTIVLFAGTQATIGTSVLAGIAPTQIAANVVFVLGASGQAATLNDENAKLLAGERLPEETIAHLGRAPVDIEPTNATVAIASGLNWKPTPSLQAYLAYDRQIDAMNVASLRDRAQGFVLYTLDAIDGRYPFGDSPQMIVTLACRFRADGTLAQTRDGGTEIVLVGPGPDRCSQTGRANAVTAFGRPFSIPHDPRDFTAFTQIAIRTQYSVTGRIRKSLFRVGDLFITLAYDDGTSKKYRVVPEAAALGMIIEPSPRTFPETRAFFDGTLAPNVRSIIVTTDVPASFSPQITIELRAGHRRP